MAKSNRQQLDELLGIMDELSKKGSAATPPSPQSGIPDDLPGSGTEAMKQTVQPLEQVQPVQSPPAQPSVGDLIAKDDAELMATEKNLQEIDELIVVSKNVMNHVYGVVTSTDILDAATISAAAKLISETRALIAEHLTIQKDERDYLNKVQMENIKHRHQMELMEKKFELEQKRFQQKNPALSAPANNVQPMTPASNGMKAYSSADLRKMIEEDNG